MKSKTLTKYIFPHVLLTLLACVVLIGCESKLEQALFDGETFIGWEGDTTVTWRIIDGTIVGGSLTKKVPNNNFLVTTKQYEDFVLRLKFKLEGTDGFINAGVQFHSLRLDEPDYEMIGYQADMGKNYWGALYDESRRKKVLQKPDSLLMKSLVNFEDWNDYEIRTKDGTIQLFLNGQKTVDYTETDSDIPQKGYIGLQIHGDGKAQVSYKDIVIEELN
jgi:hypothetical protein